MIVSKKHKFVYVSQQRTGSHTMFHVLKSKYGGVHHKHDGYHGRKVPKAYRSYHIFSTCRNPYARAVSIWRVTVAGVTSKKYGAKFNVYNQVPNDTFPAFAHWLATRGLSHNHSIVLPQYTWLDGVCRLDNILQIENINSEVLRLPFWDPNIAPGYAKNRTDLNKPHWSTYYTDPKTIEWIQKWAGPDFKRYGYSKEIPIL